MSGMTEEKFLDKKINRRQALNYIGGGVVGLLAAAYGLNRAGFLAFLADDAKDENPLKVDRRKMRNIERPLLGFVLPFGIAFELPVVCYVLGRTGIITCENLVSARRCVTLIIFIISVILTPPDVLSQVMMALPLCVLYEVSIFVMRICNRGAHAPQSD